MRRKGLVTISLSVLFLLISADTAGAQQHELGAMLGAQFASDRTASSPPGERLDLDSSVSYQFNYAGRVAYFVAASLHYEILLAVTPTTNVNTRLASPPRDYSSVYFTPGLKLKILPGAGVTPYVAAGAGFARFNSSDRRQDNLPNTGSRSATRGVVNVGGGLDVKVAPFVSVRGEIRDFISGSPRFNVPLDGSTQHNLIVSVGVVLRF